MTDEEKINAVTLALTGPKFQIGDRVQLVNDFYTISKGTQTTIVRVDDRDPCLIYINPDFGVVAGAWNEVWFNPVDPCSGI